MGMYELGSDNRQVVPMMANPERARLAAAGDMRFAAQPAMIPVRSKSPAGSSSVQVHRAISARANRTLGDDGQLEGFSFKGLVKGITKPINKVGTVVKKGAVGAGKLAVKALPAAAIIAGGVGGALLAKKGVDAIGNKKKAKAAAALPVEPTPVYAAESVQVAPDMTLPAGQHKPKAAMKHTEKSAIDDAAKNAKTAKAAHDKAQDAKKASKELNQRSQKLAGNSRNYAAKAEQLAKAGDMVGANKFAQQARAAAALAQNTAVAAETAGNYAERAGNAIAAGTDAAIAAAATNSEGFGGLVAKIQANPLPYLGGAAVLAFGAVKLLSKKKRAA